LYGGKFAEGAMKSGLAALAIVLALGTAGTAAARTVVVTRTVTVTRTTSTIVTRTPVRTGWHRAAWYRTGSRWGPYWHRPRHVSAMRSVYPDGCMLPPHMVADLGVNSPYCKAFIDRHYWIAPLWAY
jgi:hypothetical protein